MSTIADDPKELLKRYQPTETLAITNEGQMCTARFSPCGTFLFAGGFDGRVHCWDARDNSRPVVALKPRQKPGKIVEQMPRLFSIEGHNGWVQDLRFHPTEKLIFSADSWGQIRCSSYAETQPTEKWSIKEAHNGWIHSLAVNPSGTRLASVGIDGVVRVWSTKSGEKLHEFAEDGVEVHAVLFHPDGKSLVSGDLKGRVKQWDLQKGKKVRELDASALFSLQRLQDVGGVRVMTFDDEGTRLLCGGTLPKNGGNVQGTATVLVFDWKSGELKQTVELGKAKVIYPYELVFHPDGFLMVALSGNPGAGMMIYQRLEDKEPFFTLSSIRNCHSLSLHPNGYRLAVIGTNNGSNGNGRRLDKEGNYFGNYSPIHILDMPQAEPVA